MGYHLKRIEDAMNIFQFEFDQKVDDAFIQGTVNPKDLGDAKVRLNFFRDSPGSYTPDSNQMGFTLDISSIDRPFYLPVRLNLREELQNAPVEKGKLGTFPDPKPVHSIFTIKTLSSAYYVLAALYKKQNEFDFLLITDTNGNVLEELSSNIILVKDDVIYVPPMQSGMVLGATLRYIYYTYQFQIEEQAFTPEDILNADEVYLSQGTTGVRRIEISNK